MLAIVFESSLLLHDVRRVRSDLIQDQARPSLRSFVQVYAGINRDGDGDGDDGDGEGYYNDEDPLEVSPFSSSTSHLVNRRGSEISI